MSGACAAVLLKRAGHAVEVFDTRNHIGGNCYDERNGGVTVHQYGPHVFHTNNTAVWNFLSRFTEWTGYRHEVVADTRLGLLPIPWSLASARTAGRDLSDDEIRNLIFVDYSEKQWGVPFHLIPDAIRNRIHLRRSNDDTRYFTDTYQGQPREGYTAMFSRMFEGISVHTAVPRNDWRRRAKHADLHIYTGKLDEYFEYKHGALPYRSLRFEHTRSRERQCHAVINQCNRRPWTRNYDHAFFLNEAPDETIITREYPQQHDETNEPFYPMPFGSGRDLCSIYRRLAETETRTVFLGRLATYCYLDMWMAIAQVMTRMKCNMCSVDRNDIPFIE